MSPFFTDSASPSSSTSLRRRLGEALATELCARARTSRRATPRRTAARLGRLPAAISARSFVSERGPERRPRATVRPHFRWCQRRASRVGEAISAAARAITACGAARRASFRARSKVPPWKAFVAIIRAQRTIESQAKARRFLGDRCLTEGGSRVSCISSRPSSGEFFDRFSPRPALGDERRDEVPKKKSR